MFCTSRSISFFFSFLTVLNYFCRRLAFARVSDSSRQIVLRRYSMRRISRGDTTKSHLRPPFTQLEHRSESGPTRHCLSPFTQVVQGRIATSTSSRPSSRLRTDGLQDLCVRRGGMKDGWFLGTRNLGGGANVRTNGMMIMMIAVRSWRSWL